MQDLHLLDLDSLAFLVPRGIRTFFPDVRTHHDLGQLGRLTLNAFADHWERSATVHRQHLEHCWPASSPSSRCLFMLDCVAALRRLAEEAHPQMPLAAPLRKNNHFAGWPFVEYRRTPWYERKPPFTVHPNTAHTERPVRHAALMTFTEFAFFAERVGAFQRWLAIAQLDRVTHDGFTDFDAMQRAMDGLYHNPNLRARVLNSART